MREFALMLGFGLLGIALGTGASVWQFSRHPIPQPDQLGAVSFPIKAFHDMSTEPPSYLTFKKWMDDSRNWICTTRGGGLTFSSGPCREQEP